MKRFRTATTLVRRWGGPESDATAAALVGIGWFLVAGFLIFIVAPALAESPNDVGDARTSALQLIGGSVLAIGAFFTARTYQLNRTGQITERFTRAIEQLGDDKLEIRLGGIYALEQIAREPGSNHHPQIMEVLTAYVRERAPAPRGRFVFSHDGPSEGESEQEGGSQQEGEDDAEGPKTGLAADIQAVMTVLGRRRATIHDTQPLDLALVALNGVNLAGGIWRAHVSKGRIWMARISMECIWKTLASTALVSLQRT